VALLKEMAKKRSGLVAVAIGGSAGCVSHLVHRIFEPDNRKNGAANGAGKRKPKQPCRHIDCGGHLRQSRRFQRSVADSPSGNKSRKYPSINPFM